MLTLYRTTPTSTLIARRVRVLTVELIAALGGATFAIVDDHLVTDAWMPPDGWVVWLGHLSWPLVAVALAISGLAAAGLTIVASRLMDRLADRHRAARLRRSSS